MPRFHKASLIPQAADALAAEKHERGKRVVVVVDEAHLLAADQLEEFRRAHQRREDSHSAFACLPARRPPHSAAAIKLGTFAALDQRIALRFVMPPMTGAETANYVAHHLKLAGRADTLFSDDAVAPCTRSREVFPRRSTTSLQALVAAYAAKKAIVDESSARAAVTEITAD